MGFEGMISIIVIVLGAVIGVATTVPRLAKLKFVFAGGKAMAESLAASRSEADDTPGVITPAEWAEGFQAGAEAAKAELKDM